MSCVPSCPSKEGFVERDGVKLHYEVYGDGPETMVFLPPWSIVHSRVYKAQLPYFSERFRCITYDRPRQRQVRPAGGSRGLLAGQLRGRRARRHGRDRCRQGDPGRSVLWRHARLHPGRTPSRAREGGRPGRHSGDRRARLSLHDAEAFPAPSTSGSRAGTSTIASTGWPTIPTSPSTSSATSSPSRTRPSRSRTASNGPTRPRGPVLAKTVEARAIAAGVRRQRGDVSQDPLSGADDPRRQRPDPALCARASWWPKLTGAELVTIPGGGHNPLGRYPGQVQRADHRFPRSPARHSRARKTRRADQQGEEGALSVLADRPRPRPPRHRHHPRTAQASSRTCRSTGWRRTR